MGDRRGDLLGNVFGPPPAPRKGEPPRGVKLLTDVFGDEAEQMRRAASTITGSDPDAMPKTMDETRREIVGESPILAHLRSAPVNPGPNASPQEKLAYDLAYGQWQNEGKRMGRAREREEQRSAEEYRGAREQRRSRPIDAGDSEIARSGVKFWQRIKALGAGGGRAVDSALTSMGLNPDSDVSQWLKAKAAASEDFSQRPVNGEQTWADLKKKPTVGGLAKFVIENSASSLADMGVLASGVGIPAYIGMQSGSIGQQRAENNADLTANATGRDVLAAMPAATASALLERLGMHGIFGSTARTVVGRIAQAGGTEALTEALQSPIEYAGSNLGTKAGFDWREAGDQALAGVVAGGPMGAGIRGGIELGSAAMRPRVAAPGSNVSAPGAEPVIAPDLGPATDFHQDSRTGQPRTFTSAREAGLYATQNRMADQVNVMDAGNGSYVLKKVKPVSAVSDAEVLTPEDRASPIPDDVIAAGRREQASAIDPESARAKVDAFTADPTTAPAPSPEEAIAALNARRSAPIGQAQPDTIAPAAPVAPARSARAAAPAAGGVNDFVARTGQAESGGDATASNPKSSATGTHQFIDSTWLSLMRSNRARETAGMSDAQVLALRNNPLISAQMAAVYARQNGAYLRKNGHAVDNGTLYLSHFLGAGGANAVLSADPSTPVDQILKAGQISANRSVLAGKTAQQVIDWAYGKMGGSRAETASRPAPLPDAPAAEASQYETEGVNDFITRVLGDENGGGDATLEEASDAPEGPEATPANGEGNTAPDAATAAPRSDVAVTSAGREVPVSYKLVEADSLVTSNLDDGRVNPAYPKERQPRDRSRGASQAQIQRIASELDPRRVGRSVSAADGAPIISPEGYVESGNGRTLAIQRAYAMGGEQAQRYRDFLTAEGFDVSGMRNPVLVRERSGDMAPEDVAGFIKEANERDTLAYSATEQTQSDAGAMPDSMLDLYRAGDVDSADNRQFVRAFMQGVVGANDQGNMVAADGTLSQQAVQRIRGALLYRAFGDERIVSQAFEATDSHIRAIAGAMTDVAAGWAKLRAAVADGRVADNMDITANITEAVAMIDRARREGRSVADLVGQRDAFSGAIDPVTEGALTLFFNGPRFTKPASRAKLAQALGYYVDQAMMAAPGGGLFGDQAQPGDILDLAKGKPGEAALDLEPAAEQQQPVAAEGAGRSEPATGERDQRPSREGVAPREREQAREPVAAAPAPASAPTVEDMPSGKSVIIKGATDEQLARVRAALPEKVQPIENKTQGGIVYSKKHEAKIRAALAQDAAPATASAEAAPANEDRDFGTVWASREFKNAMKPLGDLPHRESPVAAATVRGWLDGKAGDMEALSRYEERVAESTIAIKSSPNGGQNGFNPRVGYVEGFYAAAMGQAVEVRTVKAGNTIGIAQAVDAIDKKLNPPAPAGAPAPATTPPGRPVPQRTTDKKNPNPYVRNGERFTVSERVDYLSPGETYVIESASAKSAYFRNVETGGGTSLQNYAMQGALRRGVMSKVEEPAAATQTDDAPPEFTAPRAEAAPKADAKPKVSENRIFTEDAAEKARAKLREMLNRVNSGIDPELLQAGITLAGYHIERGARTFTAYTKAMVGDLGEVVRPYLRGWYEAVRYYPGMDSVAAEMSDAATIEQEVRALNAPAPREEAAPAAPAVQAEQFPRVDDLTVQLRGAFAREFAAGRSFSTITEARKFAADLTGEKFAPGTPAAKALDEAIETAVVQAARTIAASAASPEAAYRDLVALYEGQPKLGVRTSTSVEQQAYSTPVPLAFLASRLAGIDQNTTVYEPSAGNGALLIDSRATYVQANELNEDRAAALRALYRGAEVTTEDATTYLPADKVDAVIANPPFGPVRDNQNQTITFNVDGPYRTNEIDHAIAWQALKAMKDDGRAVLIVGSVAKTAQSDAARSDAYNGKAKREFYLKLYRAYNVTDHFTVAGELYERQGAGWPVDVVVIEGRGKSALPLPAVQVPRQYASWDALSEVLTSDRGNQAPDAVRQPDRSDSGEGSRARAVDVRDPDASRGRRDDRRDGIGSDEQPDVVRDGPVDGQSDSARVGAVEGGRVEAVADQGSQRPAGRDQRPVNPEVAENERQVAYTPGSGAPAMGTLVPVNMQTAVNDAIAALRERVGETDTFVANRLGYSESELFARFGGEQVDAIALAIDNIERGAGFIIGDQTGIGKGRVVAAVIRYAMRQNRAPIFVTEKPNLYKDMFRDMTDIGVPEMLGRDLNILMTDAAKTVPLDDEGTRNLRTPAAAAHNAALERIGSEGLKAAGYDVLFTTYSQMQSIGGETTARQRAIRALANGGVLILDESHNAGGQGPGMMKPKESDAPTRAAFVRELVGLAHGVFYSSATYAKRPDVMDLYAATDMRLAVDDLSKLGDAIAKGGVPMQQIVASMLARSGQYLRRERSFDGIAYNTPQVEVDRRQYEAASAILKSIQLFSEEYVGDAAERMNEELKAEAESVSFDGSTGGAGAASTNFTAIMHNVIDQMLLAFKAEAAADRAIEAIERGEKPVITVANTLESLLTGYAEEEGVKIGQTLDITFADVFRRYLERSRWVSVRKPFMEKGEKAERVRLTDEQLGAQGARAFREAMALIDRAGLENLPGSPIDAMIGRIKDRGYKVAEITGRTLGINYRDGKAYLMARGAADKSIAGRIRSITEFNDGTVDVMMLNQSGATGLSLHASAKFKDQRKRRMIIAQAERNIDTHMQMLGRVHRTGQVVLPEYDQLVAGIPAEKRPASVLAKKMASLNANTTGARDSAVTAKDVPDFMNVYGDEVAARVMMEEPDIHDALGRPLTEEEEGYAQDGAMRKVTGRIPLLPLRQQEEIYDRLETEYSELLANKEAAGENALEAKTLDLDARVEDVSEAVPAVANSSSPFAAPVNVERVQIKRLGKPYPTARVREMIDEGKGQAPDIRKLRGEGEAFMRAEIAAASDSAAGNLRKRLTDNMEMFDKLAHIVKVGEGVKLKTDNGNLYGVVVALDQTGKPKNPLALGSFKATIALVDASRQITVPFSQLAPDTGGASVASKIMIERVTKIGDYPILKGFDMMQTDSRETRNIITGNILAGFYFMNSRGAIINFTDSEGGVRQGILAPRGWSLEKQQKVNGVPLTDARAIVDFLALSTNGITGKGRTGDVVVQLFPQRGDVIVTASKSKKAGGEFFLNRDLTTALRTDFVSNSSGMVARARADTAGPALEVLLKSGVRFEVPGSAPEETKQRAREVMQKYGGGARFSRVAPSASGGFDFDPPPPPRGGMTAAQRAELEARQKQGMARRGGQQGLGDQEGGLFASERDQGSLFSRNADEQTDQYLESDYEQVRARLAAEVAKLGLGDRIVVSVLDKIFGDSRIAGSYDRGVISVALASSQSPDTTLDHEVIHALRDLGLFRSAEWTALSKAAAADEALMNSIRQRYGQQGLSEEGLVEEAVSDMYARWRGARRAPNGFMQSAFQRIADLFAAIRRLVGRVPGAADVMRSIERGEVGSRESGNEGIAGDSSRWSIPGPGPDSTTPNRTVLDGLRDGITRLIGNGEGISERIDEWRTRLQDRMLPLLRTQQRIELESGRALPEALNPYLAEELMTGKVGARLERLQDDHVTPLFDAMKAEGVTTEELETYLYARHAPERNARIAEINPAFEEGTGSGMSDAEAGSIMERIAAEGKTEALERVAARVDALLKFAVDTRVESGLLSSEEAEAWATTYQHYVPLRGMAEIEPETGSAERPRSGSGINIRGSESRRAFGRRSRADNILAYSLLQAEEAIVRAGTNEVAQSFYQLAKANPDEDFWTINKVTRKPTFNTKIGQVSYRSDSRIAAEDADYTVSVKIDGQERRVTMNRNNPAAARLAAAMRNLNGTQVAGVLRLMSSVNRFLSFVNTGLNPEFVITNAFRDLQTASVNLQGFDVKGLTRGVLKDYPAALKGSINGAFKRDGGEWGRWYREFVDNGGRVYFNRVDDLVELERRIKKEFSTGNPGVAAARKGVSALFKFIENANTGVENAVRLSAYKNARQRGMTEAQAASLAKNLTVNFNRRGGWGVAMNSMYLFYNASVQGSARLIQGMGSKRVRRVLYGAIAAGALLEVLNMMLTGTDDDGETYYEKISDFDKSRNLIVMIPGGEGRHIKIPLPYGYNAFFAMGRAPVEMARGRKWTESAAALASTIVDSFNPIGGTNSLLNFLAPTIADPIVDLQRNRDYADRPIMPEQNQYGPQTPDAQRYWSSVNPHWRAVTDFMTAASGGDEVLPGAIDVSPETLQYLSGVVTGAAGTFFIDRVGGTVEKVVNGEDVTANDLPLVRKVMGQRPSWYDKATYYDRVSEIEQVKANVKDYREAGNDDAADAYEDRNAAMLDLQGAAKTAKKQMKEIRDERRELEKDRATMPAADYRAAKRKLADDEAVVVTEFNTEWNDVMKPR